MDFTKIQAEARELLDFELQREVWTLPTKKAERMEAYEARHDALVSRLVAQARQHRLADAAATGQAVIETAQAVTRALAEPAPAPAPAPAKSEPPPVEAGDLTDDFDSPAF
jgi:hypothetical protein